MSDYGRPTAAICRAAHNILKNEKHLINMNKSRDAAIKKNRYKRSKDK